VDRLALRVLGGLEVDGVEPHAVGSRKARMLLRLLALARGRVVPTSDIVDALWGGRAPTNPADQVAVLASRLRRTLGRDRIEHVEHGYRLRFDWLDGVELETLTTEIERRGAAGNRAGAAAAARVALSLLRAEAPELDDDPAWVREEVGDLRALARRTRRLAAEALLAAGSWLEAADLCEADLRRDPYDEDAVRLLMRANTAGGRPAVALAAYAALADRLAEELGADPAAETAELHLRVLRDDPALGTSSAPAASGLVGRTAQLAHLDSLVARAAEGEVQLATVIGEAGIGKTSLLAAWTAARRAAGDVVISGACGPLDRAVPLDALFVALGDHLEQLDRETAEVALGDEGALLRPLLGLGGPAGTPTAGALLPDGWAGPALLYRALDALLARLASAGPLVITIDDAHLAGTAFAGWLSHLRRSALPVVVVAACRLGEGEPLPVHDTVELGPLDRDAAAELVGEDRVDDLLDRSQGHPLFLLELASADRDELPRSLVEAISEQCDELGDAAALVRAAAVLGPPIDLDLLASILEQPVLQVLDGVELATRRGLLLESAGAFSFRHDLVRAALAVGASAGRTALLHREASRVLAGRPEADPVRVAEHARLGGDLPLAATQLRGAAARAADRFDPGTAEELLGRALELHPEPETRLARARIRTLRGDYAGALVDVDECRVLGPAALEVGAWASYFGRDFAGAIRFATDGAVAGEDTVRTRCLMVGGRIEHARGDLRTAEGLLGQALEVAHGPDRVAASAWLGVLRAHQSRVEEALSLLSPATSRITGFEQTSAVLHALLFRGHAHALAGRPAQALADFASYTEEVERRQVPRFVARGANFSGWVLRNVGQPERAAELHQIALAASDPQVNPELAVAALEDLADDRLLGEDPDGAAEYLAAAEEALAGDLVFGWRLEMRLRLLRARHTLAIDAPAAALEGAETLRRSADEAGVPRYGAVAALVAHRARHRLGESVDLDAVERDLQRTVHAVGVEAWWWAGETGADLGVGAWVNLAERLARDLARQSGPAGLALQRSAERRLDGWTLRTR
jgi:DNA-binding SARP family transcriptional activator/tetratricopeptide (TPR) repeat protein